MRNLFKIGLLGFCLCCAACGLIACGGETRVSGISFNVSSVELYAGDEYSLEYTILPVNAENVNVSFYSSDESIVTVQGGVVYAVSQGSATVTVTTEDGGYTDICYITVISYENDNQGGDTDNPEEQDGGGSEVDDGGEDGRADNEDKDENDGNDDTGTASYKVTFIAGDETVAVRTFTEDDMYVEEPEIPQVNGYTAEWESYELTLNDISVHAVYTPIIYNICFVDDGGGIILQTTYTVEGLSVTEPQTPTREHYNGEWEAYELSGGDLQVKAVYTPIEYIVKFLADGETVSEQVYTIENPEVTIPVISDKDGYTAEWQTFVLTGGDITVNAVYATIEYTITFMAEGYTVDKVVFTVETDSFDEPAVPSKAGYECSWENYSLVCDNITVNAVYSIINYTIIYENTKGADNPNADSFNVNNVFALQDISVDGYNFEGWYIGDKKITSVNSCYEDITVTARWSPIQYKVIFTDYKYEAIETVYYTVEDEDITLPDVPEREGYIGVWSDFKLTYGNDVYVHAVYTKI